MAGPRVSLDQWRALLAVVDHGGYVGASDALARSPSTVSYAVHRLQESLGLAVLEVRGRRAVPTEAGELVIRRARSLVEQAGDLERIAGSLAAGWAPVVTLAVETVYPNELLLESLDRFARESPDTRIELVESVLSGTVDSLLDGTADLAVSGVVPPGFMGDSIIVLEFIAVAGPHHPLHRLGRRATLDDLRRHRQLVVRDSGQDRRLDAGWLGAEQRWTVSTMSTSIQALCRGLGFAWMPRRKIRRELASGELVPLDLLEGGTRRVELYLVYADRENPGPAPAALARHLTDVAAGWAPSAG